MKNLIFFLTFFFFLTSCSENKEQATENQTETETETEAQAEVSYSQFGAEISGENALDFSEMAETFKNLEEGDTIPITFKSDILEVCQKKGCWMKMDLEGEKEAFVRFKDYGFFVPMNAAQHEGIVSGRAFISTVTVDELKHFAKDAGKPQEEIDEITEPKITFSIQADGVLIKDVELPEQDNQS